MSSFSDRGPGIDQLRGEGDVEWLAEIVARRKIVERDGRVSDLAVPLRLMAVEALAEIGSDEARDALASALRDPQHSVRLAAVRALRNQGDKRAAEPLVDPGVAEADERAQQATEAARKPGRGLDAKGRLRAKLEEARRERDEAASLLRAAWSERGEAQERAQKAERALSQSHREAEQRMRRQVAEARREAEQRTRAEAKKRLEAKIAKLRQERDDAASAHKNVTRRLREVEKLAEEQAREAHREAEVRMLAALREADERARDEVARVSREAEERAAAQLGVREEKQRAREERLRRERDETAEALVVARHALRDSKKRVRGRLRAARREVEERARAEAEERRRAEADKLRLTAARYTRRRTAEAGREAEERAAATLRERETKLRQERDTVASELEAARAQLREAEKGRRKELKEARRETERRIRAEVDDRLMEEAERDRRKADDGLRAEIESLRRERDEGQARAASQLEALQRDLAEEREARGQGTEPRGAPSKRRISAAKAQPPSTRNRSGSARPKGTPLNLNQATLEDLRGLEMSMTQAKRVLTYREQCEGFDSVDDLESLPGFPKAFLAEIKQRITT